MTDTPPDPVAASSPQPADPKSDDTTPDTVEPTSESELSTTKDDDHGAVVSGSDQDDRGAVDTQGHAKQTQATMKGLGSNDGADDVEGEEEEEEEEEEDDDDDEEEDEEESEEEEEEDEDEEEDDEPKLKYARLTQHMSAVYRNGDATSAFVVAGDKMITGTHNGNIHITQLPMFHPLRVYHAHAASVTSISISPYPLPPLPSTLKSEAVTRAVSQTLDRPSSRQSNAPGAAPSSAQRKERKGREVPAVPNVPWNQIHIGTSSMDGNVCVQSLIDMKDVTLRNFARPVHAVALSPDYKNDKTYLSGGTAGSLILTVGAPQGKSTSTTVGTAAATASGWLGTMGLGQNTGKDSVLHSGEGTISTIKWSLSGKYVVWLNEHGIKIMRSKLHLDSADAEHAWKRIGHIDRPQTDEWEEMAGVWKGRAEWIDEQAIESDDSLKQSDAPSSSLSPAALKLREQAQKGENRIERLLVGWGGTVWIINVHPESPAKIKSKDGEQDPSERSFGRAEIVKLLRMDCIISGISLYTEHYLLVLAYCKPEDEDDDEDDASSGKKGHKSKGSTTSAGSQPSGGIKRRQNAQPPELRLIDLNSQAEIDKDSLTVSRYERLTSNDYHIGILPAHKAASVAASRGALEALTGLGSDMWNAAINPRALFSSGASVKSRDSNEAGSTAGTIKGSMRVPPMSSAPTVHPNLIKPGSQIFIHSPYDCILATKRDLGDHLSWLAEHERYEEAWNLLDENPEIVNAPVPDQPPGSPDGNGSVMHDDFFDDPAHVADMRFVALNSAAEKEKRRISDLWIQQLMDNDEWDQAAQVTAKVVNTPDRWQKFIYSFAGAGQLDRIVNHIPSEPMHPPIPSAAYETVLTHYIRTNKPRFKELMDRWGSDLFEAREITTALENQLKYRDVREDSIDDGEKGRDWRIVMESLSRLYEENGRYREALKCSINLRDADSAMRMIREYHLADAVTDDVASFIALRVPEAKLNLMGQQELDDATSEAISLLVDEAARGMIPPSVVVSQLEEKDLNAYLYFYFRGLWSEYRDQPTDDSISLVDDFADLAVRIFVMYDRELLMDFLKVSTSYRFEDAVQECENANFIPELVYLYSKTGQVKRALYLIIDRLGDVSQAIAFAKEQDDPDLWEDLLNYSMDKPRFIRGLLEEVGTAINPITLVRRIPEGLEIPGLREGLQHIMKEHEIQHSISSGVARVLRSEVAAAQAQLRSGQRRGVKFEVAVKSPHHIDVEPHNVPPPPPATDDDDVAVTAAKKEQPDHSHRLPEPGHCARCHEPFTEYEMETLVGFACGHVFHITHLLEYLYPGQEQDPAVLGGSSSNYADDGVDRTAGGRFVGSKVTHARLLRDRVEKGCPVCMRSKMEEIG